MTDDLRIELPELGTATLGECGASILPPRIRAAWPGARLCGPAFPARCSPGDNLAIHVALSVAEAGSVLAVDVGPVPDRGYWGEVLTTAAEVRGLAGLVIDGGVRDSAALAAHGFPVFASVIALEGCTKRAVGTAGSPVELAGVPVTRGDWLVGDEDGVVVLPRMAIEQIVSAAKTRAETERRIFDQLRQGSTTLELLALDPSPVRIQDGGDPQPAG